MMLARLLAITFALTLFIGTAIAADQPAPTRLLHISATVETLDGQTLKAKTASGEELSLTLPAAVQVLSRKPAALADVKPGQFIGCTAVEGEDGKLHAKEIHILPESMRGVGEGHYPWGNAPKTTMTNGNVEQIAGVMDGHSIKVSYHGGQSDIDIPAGVSVTTVEVVGRDRLKPGSRINLFMHKDPGGRLTPQFIGIVP